MRVDAGRRNGRKPNSSRDYRDALAGYLMSLNA
jgi:hypothetical protein